MDFLAFSKEHYFHETNKRHQLANAVVVPIGILTVTGGGLVSLAKSVDSPYSTSETFVLVGLTAALIPFVFTIFFIVKSLVGYIYKYIPTPEEILDYRDEMISHYSSHANGATVADARVETYVLREYAKNTHINTLHNDKKSGYIHRAYTSLIWLLLATACAATPYVIETARSAPEIQKIEFVGMPLSGETKMVDDDKSEEKPANPPSTGEGESGEPTPPPSRSVKESATKPESKES